VDVAGARAARRIALVAHQRGSQRAGVERFPGYVRMRAERPAQGPRLPRLKPAHYPPLATAPYRGLWGHKLLSEPAEPPAHTIVLGLYQGDEPIGLCLVAPAERLIDGPGVLPPARMPQACARLLTGACAELGPGPVHLDSWGDAPTVIGACEDSGFDVVERVTGWQLRLDPSRSP
jgi:hypothetical protein